MGIKSLLTCTVIAILLQWTGVSRAQEVKRPFGQPFSGRLAAVPADATRPTPSGGSGVLFAILLRDKLSVNGRFDGMSSPATLARLYSGSTGEATTLVELTVTKATRGTIKGSLTLSESQIQELKKGGYYVQIDTEPHPRGALRGSLQEGDLK
jgi:hypothetical protein